MAEDKEIISTPRAPAAIGTYSQAVKTGRMVFLSGQIPLDPKTMELVDGDIRAQIRQAFENLAAVAEASGGSLADAVRVTVDLTDLAHFPAVNEIMAQYFAEPYPARAAIGVAALPRGAAVVSGMVGLRGLRRRGRGASRGGPGRRGRR